MNFKKRGFSLLELVIVIAISSVLLLITTDKFILGAVKSNNNYNQEIDLQSGVKNSMDNIKNILKKSVQVHLVGKEVYTPNMDLSRLDNNYSYIAFREDGGNRFLANLVYNKATKRFDIIPLMAIDKEDNLSNTNINYNLKFYEDDKNYKQKLEKSTLTLTVEGKSKVNGVPNKDSNLKEFELKEDFILSNVNQILISRHLKGNIGDITAIAYDDGLIKPKKKSKLSLVFIIDASASMKETLDGNYLFKYDDDEYYKTTIIHKHGIAYEGYYKGGPYKLSEINKYREWNEGSVLKNNSDFITRKVLLEYALNEVFLTKLDSIARDKNLDLSVYMFTYNSGVQYPSISSPESDTFPYFYYLSTLESQGYGPYYLGLNDNKLKDLKFYVSNGLKMSFSDDDHYQVLNGKRIPHYNAATNTGWGLLQGLEILKQLELRNVEDRFLVLLTDGDPTVSTHFYDSAGTVRYLSDRKYYNQLADKNNSGNFGTSGGGPLEYVKEVTRSDSGNNDKGLYKSAYIIGFGDSKKLQKLGIRKINGKIEGYDGENIYSYMASTGNEINPFMADNPKALRDALDQIVEDVAQKAGIFDGPNKMK